MKSIIARTTVILALAAMPLLILSGCEREGPLERAGEDADRAVDRAGENIEEAGEEIKDAVNP